jgi:hypothetical protein
LEIEPREREVTEGGVQISTDPKPVTGQNPRTKIGKIGEFSILEIREIDLF